VKMPWTSLADYVVEWWRDFTQQSVKHHNVPDFQKIRLEEARREVKIELEKQKAIEAKAKTAAMEDEAKKDE